MSETIRERNTMDPAFMWDLKPFYESDAAWEEELKTVDAAIAEAAACEGTLTTAEAVRRALEKNRDLQRLISNLSGYAMLRRSEDNRKAEGISMYSRVSAAAAKAAAAVSFLEPEILALDADVLASIIRDPAMKEWEFCLQDLLRQKAHMLSGREEMILASFAEAFAAPSRASEALMDADMVFEDALDSEGNAHQVTGLNFILLQNDPDRTLRENAFRSYYKGYRNHIHTLDATFAGMVAQAVSEARLRGYDSSRQMALAADAIPEEVYDTLISTVHEHMADMHRYVRLRKRLLKLDELHYYDVYTPLIRTAGQRYTYEEAQQMVLDAVKPLGEEYGSAVREAFAKRWIDVYPNLGKTGGAYSAGTYDSFPYILTNFSGTLDSVSTIAHEMGHSMHTWHTNRSQPFQYSDYSLFVAEVASTVNENLLIEQLLQKEEDPSRRLSLLNQYLEGFKGTVYRQTMFAEFEKEAHAMAERGESLDADALCDLYEKLIREYFGEDLVIDEEVRYEWARIPHFYMLFYVYVYATGYCSAAALSEKILSEGEPAAKRYREFLSMGSSAYPIDELIHAGVDLRTAAPLHAALAKFASVLDEAEKAADQLGL